MKTTTGGRGKERERYNILLSLWDSFFEWRSTKNRRFLDIKDHASERRPRKKL